jgi:hypothetical protein
MKNSFFTLLFVAAVTFIISCTKEGPEGPQGIQGPTGPQGIQGIPGQDGNANVNSYTYNVYLNDWTLDAADYGINLLVPEITQSILDNGAVLVYMGVGSGSWVSLPYIVWNVGYASQYLPIISVGKVTIWKTDSDFFQTDNPGDKTFKVIVIAGSGFSAMPSNIDLNNYEEVAGYLNLK